MTRYWSNSETTNWVQGNSQHLVDDRRETSPRKRGTLVSFLTLKTSLILFKYLNFPPLLVLQLALDDKTSKKILSIAKEQQQEMLSSEKHAEGFLSDEDDDDDESQKPA
jgi:hypothetical protein